MGKIFQELQGNYGTRFLNQWKTGQTLADGSDAGVVNAMAMWGKKLSGFADQPERIRKVLDSLPADPPSLPQFMDLCRSVRANDKPALQHKPTPEEIERSREMSHKVASALKSKINNGIDEHWATHPRSQAHFQFILDAARRDPRFIPCLEKLVAEGVCTEDHKLLKIYRDKAWVKA